MLVAFVVATRVRPAASAVGPRYTLYVIGEVIAEPSINVVGGVQDKQADVRGHSPGASALISAAAPTRPADKPPTTFVAGFMG